MAIAWFLCQYKRNMNARRPTRYCAMDDFTQAIYTDGGKWSETEVLGNYAIVKVRANDSTLATIAAADGFTRLPLKLLNETLANLTLAQRTAIANKLAEIGYTVDDLSTFGNLRDKTLAQVLKFAASRRLKPRYDSDSDTIICDGDVCSCRPIEDVDADVR